MTTATQATADYLARVSALIAGSEAARRLRLALGSQAVEISVLGGELAAVLERGLNVTPARPGPRQGWTVSALDASVWPGLPPFPWRPADVGERGEVHGTGALRAQYDVADRTVSIVDPAARRAAFVVADARRLSPWQRAAPLRTVLHWLLADAGVALVHAAAVGDVVGGVLIAGPGGSGKSTTAVLCAAHGLRFAGDDYVALEVDPDRAIAHCVFPMAKLTADSLALVAAAAGRFLPAAALAGEDKRIVEVGSACPGSLIAALPLQAVVVPRVGPGEASALRRATAGEALRALAPTTLLQLPGSDPAALLRLGELLRMLPAYALTLGSGTNAPELIAGLLERPAHQ